MSHSLPDNRLKKSVDFSRSTRGIGEDAAKSASSSALDGEVAPRAWRNEWTAEALPSVPPIPGWHFCWASTTNQQDPPHRRIRMGYQLVKAEELPGLEHLRMKSGEWAGCISINEMLLLKIPDDLYQAMMKELHHDAPNEEEAMLRANIESNLTMKDSRGRPISLGIIEDGTFGNSNSSPFRTPHFD